MPQQKYLHFEHEVSYLKQDFIITDANILATKAIENFHIWPKQRLLIIGPEGSGKTHLSTIWQEYSDAFILKHYHEIKDTMCNIIIDDISVFQEDELFHIINHQQQNAKYLLMTAQTLPIFKLKDLQSRINATTKITIKPIDEELQRILLCKQLTDLQIKYSPNIIEYIMPRIERSYYAMQRAIAELAKLVSHKKKLSVKMVSKIFKGQDDFC